MQDLAHWLEELGMPEYTQRFAENGISVPALRHLTDQDLKDMGVWAASDGTLDGEGRSPGGSTSVVSRSLRQYRASRR